MTLSLMVIIDLKYFKCIAMNKSGVKRNVEDSQSPKKSLALSKAHKAQRLYKQ